MIFQIGKGRGQAKKGGAGGNYTWGSLGSELLDEYTEDFDEDDLDDLQYNQAKEKYIAESTGLSLENKIDQLKLIENFDKDIKPIIDEYFVNGDANDVAQSLRKFDLREKGDGELLAYIITIALEKSNVHKELISRLLHDLNGIIFRANDYINCFNTLLTTLNDLSLDNPECSTDIGNERFYLKHFSIFSFVFQVNSSHDQLPINRLIIPMDNILLVIKAMSNVRKCKLLLTKLKHWYQWEIFIFLIMFGVLNQVCSNKIKTFF